MRRLLPLVPVIWAACSGGERTTAPPAVASVQVAPGQDTLVTLGRTRQFGATALDASGHPVSGVTVVWRTSNAGVASIDSASGVATAVGNGVALIRAVVQGSTATGQASLAVAQVVASVVVTPATANFTAAGDTTRFSAIAKDSSQATVSGVRFLWGTSNAAVATVDTLGLATSRGSGTATISSTGRGIPGYAGVSVAQAAVRVRFSVAPPATAMLGLAFPRAVQVEVRDVHNNLVTGARVPVTLSVAINPGSGTLLGTTTVDAVAGVASFSGLALAGPIGGYRLAASAAGVAPDTSTLVTTGPGVPASLVASAPSVVAAGDPFAAQVQAFDAYGNQATTATDTVVLTAADLARGTLDSTLRAPLGNSVATFDSGVVTEPGHYTLTARSGNLFTSVTVDAVLGFAGSVSAGNYTACALSTSARVFCWGKNDFGQTGNGDTTGGKAVIPQLVRGDRTFAMVAVGYFHTCGVTTSGAAYCWGLNSASELGNGLAFGGPPSAVPVAVVGGHVFQEVAVGFLHTCGVTTAHEMYCWGDDSRGELGDAKAAPSGLTGTPVRVGQSVSWAHVTANPINFFTCGLAVSGAAYCWGANDAVELGDGHSADDSVPTAVVGGTAFRTITAGSQHVCALAVADSTAYCWGTNAIGRSTVNKDSVAAPVDLGVHYNQLTTAGDKTCAIPVGGGVLCWQGPASPSLQQPHSDGIWGVPNTIAMGGAFDCERNGQKVLCRGNNDYGELGNNSLVSNFSGFAPVYQGPASVAPAPRRRP